MDLKLVHILVQDEYNSLYTPSEGVVPGDSVYIVWEGFARLSRLWSRGAEKLLTILQAQVPEGSLTPYSICIYVHTYLQYM